jgi:hypothetical protein
MQSSHYHRGNGEFCNGNWALAPFSTKAPFRFFENSKVLNYKNSLNSDQKLHVFEII